MNLFCEKVIFLFFAVVAVTSWLWTSENVYLDPTTMVWSLQKKPAAAAALTQVLFLLL